MITHLRHRPPGGHRVAEDHEHRPTWWFVLIGAVGGLWLGGVARVWMRSISVDPEFSWGGTIAILMSFTLFGAAQSAAGVARRRRSPVGTIAAARSLAIVLSLGLFGAAGAIMFPTVVFGSLAVWRTDWSKPIRGALALLAVPSALVVLADVADDKGWTVETIGRMALFIFIYGAVIASTGPSAAPLARGWRPSRRVIVVLIVAVVALIALALYVGGIE